MRSLRLAIVSLLLIAPGVLHGQNTADLRLGSRVRLSAGAAAVLSDSMPPAIVQPFQGIVGRLRASDADSLLVERRESAGFQRYRIGWDALERLEISHGRSRSRGAGRGALIGGLAYGTLLGLSLWRSYPGEPQVLPQGFLLGAAIGGVAGAGLGALIGVEVWEEVPLTKQTGSR